MKKKFKNRNIQKEETKNKPFNNYIYNYQKPNIYYSNKKAKNIVSILVLFILINLFSFIFSQKINKNKKRNLQTKYSEITLRISGKGTQQILNNDFIPKPYYLEVNTIQTTFNYTINNLKYDQNNKIIMKFDSIITSCENMFYGLSNITQIDMTNFDFTEVTSMKGMFYGNSYLWKITLNTNNKISKIIDLENIFNGCNNLESIELSMIDTSLVTNMSNMFKGCYKLKYLNISNLNTSLVKDMQYMFYGCGLLTSLNIENFNTSLVTNMANMFNGCYQLKNLNLTNFKTNLVIDINSMFSYCNSLTSLDLNNFNTSLVTNMSNLFNGCISLEKINLGNFNTNLVVDMSYMFNGCTELLILDLSLFNTSLVNSMEYMFGSCYKLSYLEIYNFNTSLISDFKFMFYECKLISNLTINKFNTSLVNNMQNMFSGCESLTSIDLSNFNTSLVNNMEYMFSDCKLLTSLNITNFDTSMVTNMEFMFFGCVNLKDLDLSNFNTYLVNNMNSMFYNCKSLESLNISKFDTSKVTNMQSMFYGCSNLKFLDISNFDTSLVTDMNSMFFNCNELTSFNLYNFNTTSITYMGSMFNFCTKMNYLNFFHFKENEIINVYDLFLNGPEYLKICISNEENLNKFISELNLIKSVEREKAIIEKDKCIDKCFNDDDYKNEYNNRCYIKCPNTSFLSNKTNYFCEPIKCNKFYNFDKTGCLDNIPDGYFLNNTEKRTIDKCHSDCRTCHKKETLNSTNCDSCLNYKYLDLGNCLTNCPNNLYLEFNYSNNNNNLFCKCSYDKKCLICTLDSLKYNLCISCNKDEGYYPKESDETNFESFINCYKNLEGYYLDLNDNIYKRCYKTCKKCEKYGNKTNNNCIECLPNLIFKNDSNCYENCLYYYYFDLENNLYCTLDKKCPEHYNKLIEEKNECTENCNKDKVYKYEYENKCYKKCPEGTDILEIDSNLCEIKCENNTIFIDLKNNKCLEKCEIKDFFNGICGLYRPNLNTQKIFVKYIINEIEIGKINITNINLSIKDNNIFYQIIEFDNIINEKNNISMIGLKNCEDLLRQKYNITKNKKLIIFKTDYYIDGLYIPIVDYELFNPENYIKLDLNYCLNENINIDIYFPANFSNENNNLFKYDPLSDYYNDNCFPYKTEFGTDIIILDRKKEFNDNYMSLCEKDCKFKEYNNNIKKSKCECKIKNDSALLTNIYMDKEKLIYKINDEEKTKNSNILKCYNILFSNEGLEANIPSYIIIVLFTLFTFQLCFLRKKINDMNINKKINIKNENENASIYKLKNSPPRKDIKTKTSLYNDVKSNYNLRNIYRKSSLQIKSSKSLRSDNNNKNLNIYKIIHNFKNEDDKETININNMKDYEINILPYKKAKKYDKRTFFQYYISLIKTKYILFLSFLLNDDFYSMYIYRCILINSLILFYLFNTIFFTEEIIHEIYINKKYKINISQIIFSTLISSLIITLVRYLALPNNFDKIEKEKSKIKIKLKNFKCNVILVFVLMYIFIIFSWYYSSVFCAVYRNSQIHLFKNVLISYLIFLFFPFFFYFIPGFFRIPSLIHTKKYSECFYNLSKVIQFL